MNRWADILIILMDRQMDRRTDEQMGRYTNYTDGQMDRQTDG